MAADRKSRLLQLCARARQGTELVDVSDEAFVEHLESFVDDEGLDALHAQDLLLAFAALRGDDTATVEVAGRIVMQAGITSRKLSKTQSFADELSGILRERLLVGTSSGVPRIAQYAGMGALDGWLRVAATRTALSMGRKHSREVPIETALGDSPVAAGDLELEYLKTQYQQDFREAFRQSVSVLDDRQRNILRMHYVDGIGIDKLGQMYKVHGSSISRWMSKAREQLFCETRSLLRDRLAISDQEFKEIMALVRSQLDLSISSFLRG